MKTELYIYLSIYLSVPLYYLGGPVDPRGQHLRHRGQAGPRHHSHSAFKVVDAIIYIQL